MSNPSLASNGNGPRKPDRPLVSYVFPKAGPVREDVEHLPREQASLEVAIGSKFAASIEAARGLRVMNLRQASPADEPADVLAERENGETLLIQVVEVVDPLLIGLRRQRADYPARLADRYPKVLALFTGTRLTFVDEGEEPTLPLVASAAGEEALAEIAHALGSIGEDVGDLELGKLRSRRVPVPSAGVELRLLIERLDRSLAVRIRRTGGGRVYREGSRVGLAYEAIAAKARRYAPPANEFWLLSYSSDLLLLDDELEDLRERIDELGHPFDRIWYFYPFPNQDQGFSKELWPRSGV
ncbi:MAG: hypothetical protein O2895_04520 [Chloroflexi bacterium]|nr:hypothetical protein [Chloroflexota bacterium]